MKILFVRHGESIDDIEDRYGGSADFDLTEKGKERVTESAKKISTLGQKFEVILTSPLKRALQSAEIISNELGIEIEVFEYLKERNLIGGGNTFHLMYWVKKSGLETLLPKLLKTRVYSGISAGSCIAGHTIYNSVQNLFGEKYDLKIEKGLGLVDFQFIPHLNSPYFTKIKEKNLEIASKDLLEPVYALDDNSALLVDGKRLKVVSEGKWRKFN